MGWADAAREELESDPKYIKLLKAFRLFDKNKDGFINAKELLALLQRGGHADSQGKLTEADCETMIASFDDNGDGKLSIEELVLAWTCIGGADEDLDAAMKEKRKKAADALKKKQAAIKNQLAGNVHDEPEPEPEPEVAAEELDDSTTAAERGKMKASTKVGKAAPSGGAGGSQKAVVDKAPEEMTAAERAKAKAKAEVEAKEAKKKAARASKAAEKKAAEGGA